MLPGLEGLTAFAFGPAGVSIFFVLSGFVISYNYLFGAKAITTLRSSGSFLIARIFKIFPVHIVTFFLALPLGLNSVTAPVDRKALPFHLLLLGNFSPVPKLGLPPNKVAWSLSVEFFFYLMAPLLFIFLQRFKGKPRVATGFVFLSALIFALSAFKMHTESYDVYWYGVFRLPDFLLGICLCQVYQSYPQYFKHGTFWVSLGILEIVLVGHTGLPQLNFLPLSLQWLPGCVLIVFGFLGLENSVKTLVSKKIFILLGEASFSLYMLHELVLRYARYGFMKFELTVPPKWDWFAVVAAFAICQILAFLLYFKVEAPMQKFGKRYMKSRC